MLTEQAMNALNDCYENPLIERCGAIKEAT